MNKLSPVTGFGTILSRPRQSFLWFRTNLSFERYFTDSYHLDPSGNAQSISVVLLLLPKVVVGSIGRVYAAGRNFYIGHFSPR